jgi:hypothetical protein
MDHNEQMLRSGRDSHEKARLREYRPCARDLQLGEPWRWATGPSATGELRIVDRNPGNFAWITYNVLEHLIENVEGG